MKQQPSDPDCFVCGVRNDAGLKIRFFESETTPVEVTAEYTVPAKFQGYPGIVHGGILATMLDEVTYRAACRGEPPRLMVTARISVRYRKPVPVETALRLVGRVKEDKGKIITATGEVFGPGDVLLAEAEAVLAEVTPDFFGGQVQEDRLVYPDHQER